MTKILHVIGGNQINGSVRISGAKNSVLPIMAATLLTEQEINIENAPKLLDTLTMIDLLRSLGGEVDFFSEQDLAHKAKICCSKIKNFFISESIVSKMRASCLVLGPLLSRFKDKVTLTFPGGCTIGARPIDMHLDGLREMGAEVEVRDGVIEASARQGLSGAHIKFRSASVGATENVLMAATLARGRTIIENAAMEPEIIDLARFLVKLGANIQGIGGSLLEVIGVDHLGRCDHRIIPDRIEAGTYAMAAIITGGKVKLTGIKINDISCILSHLKRLGANVSETSDGMLIESLGFINPVDVVTAPYPGFPSDMQAVFASALTVANGFSSIIENIFDNRFMYAHELEKMGANISYIGNKKIIINGVKKLCGAAINSTDLRAAAALLVASLAASGETFINNVHYLDRGYDGIEDKLKSCGAMIERVSSSVIA